MATRRGPLAGVKVLEVGGIGASPFGNMLLADLGAEVIRVDRPGGTAADDIGVGPGPVMFRGRQAVVPLDLKAEAGRRLLLELADRADVLTEAFRPGVAERLGIGPDVVLARNPRLVYGRMTGWGQDGPLALSAGHDINYIAVAGVLGAMGRPEAPPTVPLALAGDMGGGGMILALGIVSALLERASSGRGQVVDAAMLDGAAVLMAAFWEMAALDKWGERGTNLTDGGAPFYDTYACKDGKFVAIGALEPAFWDDFLDRTGFRFEGDRFDRATWPDLRAQLAELFVARTRQEWSELLEGTDSCVSPVLDFEDACQHPHSQARATFLTSDGIVQPAPAPRFSRTPVAVDPAPAADVDAAAVLREWGVDEAIASAALPGES